MSWMSYVVIVAVATPCLLAFILYRLWAHSESIVEHFRSKQIEDARWVMTRRGVRNEEIRTWDGGINWYAVEYPWTSGLVILGRAEEVYPQLYATIMAGQKLGKSIQWGGLGVSGTVSDVDLSLIHAAGFRALLPGEEDA